MGTHLCSLPTGDHCSRSLVCLGCTHAQPKKSTAPIFRRMLFSHRRSLADGEQAGEPAGQLAARRLEIQRIEGARARRTASSGRRRPDRRRRRMTRPVVVQELPGCGTVWADRAGE